MAETPTIDITSSAFAQRLANLLVATRTDNGERRSALSRASRRRFSRRDLNEFERGVRMLDETTIDELAQLYRCDLGSILPPRLPVMVTPGRISAGGVHQDFQPTSSDALLEAYLDLVRQLRRQRRAPVVDLRRDDLEVLAGYLQQPRETVLHRLATLMNANQRKRTAMVGVLATGAAVVGLVGTVAAVGGDTPGRTEVAVTTTVSVPDSSVTTVTVAPTSSIAPVTTVATTVTTTPARPFTPRTTVPVPSTEPLVDTNLPTTPPPSVDIDNPPVPSFTDPPVTDSSAP